MSSIPNLPIPFSLPPQAERSVTMLAKLLPPLLVQHLASAMLNRVLAASLAAGALVELEGRWLAIDCNEFAYPIRIGRHGGRLLVATDRGPIDASIRGDLASFFSLLRQDCDPDTLFFQRKLIMQGDTELALAVKNFLDTIDRDQLPAWLRKLLGM